MPTTASPITTSTNGDGTARQPDPEPATRPPDYQLPVEPVAVIGAFLLFGSVFGYVAWWVSFRLFPDEDMDVGSFVAHGAGLCSVIGLVYLAFAFAINALVLK